MCAKSDNTAMTTEFNHTTVDMLTHCRHCIVLSVLPHLKHLTAVYSVKTQTKANLSRKHWLNYWHRCKHRCKSRLLHDIDAIPLKFNHTHIVIACYGPKYVCVYALI